MVYITKSPEDQVDQLTKLILSDEEVIYVEDIHVRMLLRNHCAGRDIASFCAEAGICRQTYYNWRDSHPRFSRAINIAKVLAQSWWETFAQMYAHKTDRFNTTYWSMVMRNRFGLTEHRRISIPGLKTANGLQAQYDTIIELLGSGETTAPEAAQLVKVIETGAKIAEHGKMQQDLEFLMGEYEKQSRQV